MKTSDIVLAVIGCLLVFSVGLALGDMFSRRGSNSLGVPFLIAQITVATCLFVLMVGGALDFFK